MSNIGNDVKQSCGSEFNEFCDKYNVCNESSKPLKESISIHDIWLPLKSENKKKMYKKLIQYNIIEY